LVNPLLSFFTAKITSISAATKQALVQYEYLNSKNIEVVYNGISPQQAQPGVVSTLREQYSLTKANVVFGTVARLDPIKNQTLLINAFHQILIQEPNCKLFIVGDGEERQTLEQLVLKLNITDSVIFTGYITQPVNFMNLMDVFLLPSLSEGTSMTLLEAMSLSKPCVVTDAGGNSEVILDNYNGFVTPNREIQPFVESMLILAKDEELRNKFGKNSYQRFNDIFTNQAMSRTFMSIYNKVNGK
jgi:glycosyltransferase involved in cell wall biosynthesis